MMTTMRWTALCLLLLLQFGCAGPSPIDRSVQAYDKGDFTMSRIWATKALAGKATHDEAAYMIGLSEYQLDHMEEALRSFRTASESQEANVRGPALAMVAQTLKKQGDHAAAEVAMQVAVADLAGPDRAQALTRVRKPTVLDGRQFSLQFGAYRNHANATVAADTIAGELRGSDLPMPRVSEGTDRLGRELYFVRVGVFQSRDTASLRRQRGDLPPCIVVSVQE
jgi:cell division protein FtsN